jgi:hypothetical protein
MALAASPLLSSQSLDPFLGISSLCAALPWNRLRGHIYSRFYFKRNPWRQRELEKGPWGWKGSHSIARGGAVWFPLISPSWHFMLTYFSHLVCLVEQNDVPKRLDPFGIQKFSETQKYTKNRVFCSIELKPK